MRFLMETNTQFNNSINSGVWVTEDCQVKADLGVDNSYLSVANCTNKRWRMGS